ncbi:hypothetical protein FB451DRAFT_1203591 [Mycena latifolia]|nr:hypothetical protein FB451DRAFT_1203591 [Mycena latifolia]
MPLRARPQASRVTLTFSWLRARTATLKYPNIIRLFRTDIYAYGELALSICPSAPCLVKYSRGRSSAPGEYRSSAVRLGANAKSQKKFNREPSSCMNAADGM